MINSFKKYLIASVVASSLILSGCTAAPETYVNIAGETVPVPSTSGQLEAAAATEKLIEVLEYSAYTAKKDGYTETVNNDSSDNNELFTVYDPETDTVATTYLSEDGKTVAQNGAIVDESALTPYVMRKYIKESSPNITMKDNIFTISQPEIGYTLIVQTKDGLIVGAVQTVANESEIRVKIEYTVTPKGAEFLANAKPLPEPTEPPVDPNLEG